MNDHIADRLKKIRSRGIQSMIMAVFSAITVSLVLLLCLVMYIRFSMNFREEMTQSSQKLMDQAAEKMEDYLIGMRQISDTAYYNIIKENDLYDNKEAIQKGMNLLYEANKDNLRSVALYNRSGSLLGAEPVETQKEDPNVTRQSWFVQAVNEVENMHFSTPHIQNLFDDGADRYYTVISLSRQVEINDNGNTEYGVLLVDMDYSGISRMMKQINTSTNGQYFYLCDSSGKIIYHPKQFLISDGIFSENNEETADKRDGIYDVSFNGQHRKEIISTIGYTGWKIVGVIPYTSFTQGMINMRYFVAMIIFLMGMMVLFINRVVSAGISRPILRLNDSVKEYEAGEKPKIYIGGSSEIRHLGRSIQSSYEQIDILMREIVQEQNEKRKSELDALQSQINPHFLYNTLESITWMIEGEKNDEAVFMISQLARFFRISLSKGKTIISVKDELQHARSYMNIQNVRYKDSFRVVYDVDPAVESYCVAKLVLQPILENAISYGVRGMEECGEIVVSGRKEEDIIVLAVSDNGIGMSEEEVDLLLTDSNRVHKHGSGVGLVNVNNRLKMIFGKAYGLVIESEPDEGTKVMIRIPAVPFNEENRTILENGQTFNAEKMTDRSDRGNEHED